MCPLAEVCVSYCFINSTKNSSNVAKYVKKPNKKQKQGGSCVVVALDSRFTFRKAGPRSCAGGQPVHLTVGGPTRSSGLWSGDAGGFVALCGLFVVRRVHLVGNRRTAHDDNGTYMQLSPCIP